jgi:hypothetical protein
MNGIEQAIRQGKNVASGTWSDPAKRSVTLVGNHVHAVVQVERDAAGNRTVVLRNPWGFANAAGSPTSGDPSDGIVRVTEAELRSSMFGFTIP